MIKKKIKRLLVKIFFLTIGFGGAFQSCDYLNIDPYVNDMFNLDTVFAKQEYTLKYLYNIYSHLPDGSRVIDRSWNAISDECMSTYKRDYHPHNWFSNNELLASDNKSSTHYWNRGYQGIRKANMFLSRVNECEELNAIELSEYTAEAQFLKAFFYFELMLQYGPVVIVPDEPMSLDVPLDELLLPRNTWDECAEYVENTMRTAIKGLPESREPSSLGKPTQASALAVLSRLTLYSASKLYNGNTDLAGFRNIVTNEHYFNQEYSEEKWAKAAAVAQELVELFPNALNTTAKQDDTPEFPNASQLPFPNGVGGIDPYHSYIDMFNGEALGSTNPEILFSRSSVGMIQKYYGPKYMDGFGSYSITQALVDAYYMNDGTTIENTTYPQVGYSDTDTIFSGYRLRASTHNWYMNREMRFYATVGFQNSYYEGISTSTSKKNFSVSFLLDGNSGMNTAMLADNDKDDYCILGYLCRKWLHREDSYAEGGIIRSKIWIEYRMAEVYLNYVEAMNELTSSHTVGGQTVLRDAEKMKYNFNMIRFRAGLPGITDADVADVDRMRELIERERQIEFAWEGRRYFDVRRNKTAVIHENKPVMGCNIETNDVDEYHVKTIPRTRNYLFRVFTPRQNFWPLLKGEVDKNPRMDQNPGW